MFRIEDFKGKKALIIGAGKSGIACANLLKDKGFAVLLTESQPADKVQARLDSLLPGIETETGGHTDAILECGFAVKCPGLPHNSTILAKLFENKIPIFSEVEVALSFAENADVFAVTGTNGKTTTTMLLGDILSLYATSKGKKSYTAGNIGFPVADAVMKMRNGDCMALELSSYQLEDSTFIAPHVSSILNITPDHLEHHGSMEAYIAAKKRIFRFQSKEDFCVLNHEDVLCRLIAENSPSRVLWFSSSENVDTKTVNAYISGDRLCFCIDGRQITLNPPNLPGLHNLENAMAAGLMAFSVGVPQELIQQAFDSFKPVEHRIEPAGEVNGIKFINDSKATNVDSVLVALKAMPEGRRTWLILGGRDKGAPYSPLIPLIREKAKGLLLIGEAAEKIDAEIGGIAPCYMTETVYAACHRILEMGNSGDIALFSPACSSFDQFKDFEDRGRKFKNFIRGLENGSH